MPTTVYDASLVTFRRQAKTLYGFNSVNAAAVVAGTSVKREQPTFQSGLVIITRKQGGCFCTQDLSGGNFNSAAPGACNCAR
jgi:hypothetical protein